MWSKLVAEMPCGRATVPHARDAPTLAHRMVHPRWYWFAADIRQRARCDISVPKRFPEMQQLSHPHKRRRKARTPWLELGILLPRGWGLASSQPVRSFCGVRHARRKFHTELARKACAPLMEHSSCSRSSFQRVEFPPFHLPRPTQGA